MIENIWSLLGMLAAVAAILALAYVATRWIASRGPSGFSPGAGKDETFCILRQIAVGKGERLVLLRVQDRCLLLGVTAQQITLLKELSGEEAGRWLSKEDGAAPPSFLEALQRSWPRKK